MDNFDLFRKLGVGAKFNLKRFRADAERFNLSRPQKQDTVSEENDSDEKAGKKRKLESNEIFQIQTKPSPPEKQKEFDSDCSDVEMKSDNDELTVLGNITAKDGEIPIQTDKKRKRKHKKKDKEKILQIKQEKINHLRKQHKIHVYGQDIPEPFVSFDQLHTVYNINPQIIRNIQNVGYSKPTPIQMQVIPAMLNRREVMACAPTGSGKTAAFILPILHHLKEPRNQGFRALILAPTRELAKQTYREFQRLAEGRGFRIFYIEKATTASKMFGTKSKQKFDVLVSTPNRLVFMLKEDPPIISLNNVDWLIVDESDKLFEEGKAGFRDQLGIIYGACDSKNVRRAMFSATFAYDVEEWCKLNLDNVLRVDIGARNAATETVEQELKFVGTESGKLLAIRDIIRQGLKPPVLVFVQSKERAKELFHELIYDGMNVDVIHSDRTQLQRDNVVQSFRAGKIWILICTELMGRGIDFKGVNLVINYDFPNSSVSYIHRIGRTGRAGHRGRAITLFTEDDLVNLRSIANVMKEAGCPVPDYMLQIKKRNKKQRKILAQRNPKRKSITTDLKRRSAESHLNRKKSGKIKFKESSDNKKDVKQKTTQGSQTMPGSDSLHQKTKHKGKKKNNNKIMKKS